MCAEHVIAKRKGVPATEGLRHTVPDERASDREVHICVGTPDQSQEVVLPDVLTITSEL